MDSIDLGVLRWFDDLLLVWEEVELEAQTLPPEKPFDRMRELASSYSESSRFIARHYSQALRMREEALRKGNFTWYCSATYALCHDWRRVMDSIKWSEWGCFVAVGDGLAENVRKVTTLVGAIGAVSREDLVTVINSFARGNVDDVLSAATEWRLVVEKDGRFYPGPAVPKPSHS
jgi:hypothetical protein